MNGILEPGFESFNTVEGNVRIVTADLLNIARQNNSETHGQPRTTIVSPLSQDELLC